LLFVRAYPRETQEMVFDAHDRAFALFKGTCGRGIYDNMKTAVETIFVGKERLYNRRFMQTSECFRWRQPTLRRRRNRTPARRDRVWSRSIPATRPSPCAQSCSAASLVGRSERFP
jgi:transposase